ncbi:MAG: iron-sulfur cluster repair di-iron protein [Ginsengibacter sp.]
METSEDTFLNVTILPPKLKHSTIFEKFDELISGESLTILNDHDPKPLYYELMAERGKIFSWKYLEEGPENWQVIITKDKSIEVDSNLAGAKIGNSKIPLDFKIEEENILNVTAIAPKLKHPTIFEKFDLLVPGQSLTIHNDHDPKPLYYQLLGERGNIFTWEYLQEGPELWRVKISKKLSGENEETLGEIAVKDLRKVEIFKKYGLDFCCGGKKTVREACAEKGIDVTKVEQELQQPESVASISTYKPLPYDDWSLDFLADYIVNTHHSYVKKTSPDLSAYSIKVAKVHGDSHSELVKINELIQEVVEEMAHHMVEEEQEVFSYIKRLVSYKNGIEKPKGKDSVNLQTEITKMEIEHELVGRNLELIRDLTNNYSLPADGCASYSFLFKLLQDFESDLHMHVHLENNILFPKAIELEKSF